MTDTPRTQAELLSIFADQQDHGITAQDMRDFVVSLRGILDPPDRVTLAKTAPAGQAVPNIDYSWLALMDTEYAGETGTSFSYAFNVGGHTEITLLEDGLYQLSVVANFPPLASGAWAAGIWLDPFNVEPGNLVFSGLTPPSAGEVISPAATFCWWFEAGTVFSAQFVQDSGAPVSLTYAQMSALRIR